MKIYNNNKGAGNILLRVGSERIVLRPGVNTVSEDAGYAIIGMNLNGISADKEAIAAKAQYTSATAEIADLKALVKEQAATIAKLQAVGAPVAPVAAVAAVAVDAADKPKRGRPAKADSPEVE